jgi:glutamate mutase epsilon subunit
MALVGNIVRAVIKNTGFGNALAKVAKCGKKITLSNNFVSKNILKRTTIKPEKFQNPLLQFVEKEAEKGNVVDVGFETINKKKTKDILLQFFDEADKNGDICTDSGTLRWDKKGNYIGDF